MATSYSTLLGLALPVQGELSGTWGDTVNNYITNYLDAAVAGTQTLSTDADVTLTKTTGTALGTTSSQYAIINCTGARTVLRTITAPAASKMYVVINATTGGFGVKIVGSGPTTGVTVATGTTAFVVWNGADFAAVSVVANTTGIAPVAYGGTGAATFTSGGILRGNGTGAISVASSADITTAIGTLGVAAGGTGATTLTANNVLLGNGTSALQVVAPGTSGNLLQSNGTTWSSTALTTALGTVAVSNGGTGATTLTANNVLLGNGTSAVQVVAPGTSGNVLTSNGTTWQSTAPVSTYVGARAQVFFSGGVNFTIPTGITAVKATVIGGGGGSNTDAGGMGATAIRYFTGLTSGATIAVTVGNGGNGGASPTAGGSSQLNNGTQNIVTPVVAGGGSAGFPGTPGANGTATGGDINISNGYGGVFTYGYGSGGGANSAGRIGLVIFEW